VPDLTLERPHQVAAAVSLMGVSLAIVHLPRTALVLLAAFTGHIPGGDAIYKVMDEIVIWGFSLGLLALIWHGINWARWLNLLLSIGNFIYTFVSSEEILRRHSPALIYPGAYVALECIALYLLFLSPGRLWFKREHTRSAV
jgi:hypothetical protein